MKINKVVNDFFIKLNNENVSKETFLGVMIFLLMNKIVFVKNSYVSDFIKDIFDIDMPNYATKSRTLMVAKICRVIVGFDDKELKLRHKKTLSMLNDILDEDFDKSSNKNKNKNNALSNMNKWMGGILDKNE